MECDWWFCWANVIRFKHTGINVSHKWQKCRNTTSKVEWMFYYITYSDPQRALTGLDYKTFQSVAYILVTVINNVFFFCIFSQYNMTRFFNSWHSEWFLTSLTKWSVGQSVLQYAKQENCSKKKKKYQFGASQYYEDSILHLQLHFPTD